MALSDKDISALYFEALGSQHLREQDRKMVTRFAHAVESEVRKSDEALIRQMLDALEHAEAWGEELKPAPAWVADAQSAITAANARLEGKP